jgi:tetratricopeptide (TPR) repeat protein
VTAAGLSRLARLTSAGLVVALLAGCPAPKPQLVPVPIPDAADLEPSVRSALERARAQFDRVVQGHPKQAQLADAYGELAMTYQAQSLVPPAEAAYHNARALAPGDKRWAYLLGHLYNDASRVPEAITQFEAALAIDERDSPTLLSLGEVYLQHGDFDKARAMYQRLESDGNARAAALAGLGKVALATQQYKEAVDDLEQALKLSPGSTRLRQPLAMAYRELGDRDKAEQNLRQFDPGGVDPGIVDPMADALGEKVAASRALVRRGQRAGKVGRFDLAEVAFRAAVEADPSNADAVANLGISLANLGRISEAEQRLKQSVSLDDTNAVAHLSLGVVLDRQGRDQEAIAQYRATLQHDPVNVQATVYLADATMRLGNPQQAAELYKQALKLVPDSLRMQLSLAMANVKAGRYDEARNVIEGVLKVQPGNPEAINDLARILATAPQARDRNGPRALQLAKALFQSTHDPDVGQTYAMAMAETGAFEQAVVLQKETILVLEHTGGEASQPFLQKNLALYQQHKPARAGWAPDDPVFQPRSPAARLAKSPAS